MSRARRDQHVQRLNCPSVQQWRVTSKNGGGELESPVTCSKLQSVAKLNNKCKLLQLETENTTGINDYGSEHMISGQWR